MSTQCALQIRVDLAGSTLPPPATRVQCVSTGCLQSPEVLKPSRSWLRAALCGKGLALLPRAKSQSWMFPWSA